MVKIVKMARGEMAILKDTNPIGPAYRSLRGNLGALGGFSELSFLGGLS